MSDDTPTPDDRPDAEATPGPADDDVTEGASAARPTDDAATEEVTSNADADDASDAATATDANGDVTAEPTTTDAAPDVDATGESATDSVTDTDSAAEAIVESTTEPVAAVDAAAEPEPVDPRAERWAQEAAAAPVIDAAVYRRRSRRAFLGFGAAMAAGFLGFRHVQSRPETDNIPDVVRRGLEANEALWSGVGSETRLARTFDLDDRQDLRVNGRIGVRDEIDLDAWQLNIVGVDGEQIDTLTLADVQALGSEEIVWQHKCIEGWATIVGWTGARFSDLANRYYGDAVPADHGYVALRTPDDAYYVGLDRELIHHPQTLLAWALNGEPLTQLHGAPLRLATPVVYGIKQLKRIGTIEFTNERPADYWAERGYDWHARF